MIGLVYHDDPPWPSAPLEPDGCTDPVSLMQELIFLGVVGIQDPVRPGLPEAVTKAKSAGVVVRMTDWLKEIMLQLPNLSQLSVAFSLKAQSWKDQSSELFLMQTWKLVYQSYNYLPDHLPKTSKSSSQNSRPWVKKWQSLATVPTMLLP